MSDGVWGTMVFLKKLFMLLEQWFFLCQDLFARDCLLRRRLFPCNAIWIPQVPRKVCFFSWLAAKRGDMAKNLRKWKVVCVNWCYMCKEGERMWIIFFYIVIFIMRIWRDMLRWFGISWAMPQTMKYFLFFEHGKIIFLGVKDMLATSEIE